MAKGLAVRKVLHLIPATSKTPGSSPFFELLHSTPLQFGFLPAAIGRSERQRAGLDPSFRAVEAF